jgi:hypothetical protein
MTDRKATPEGPGSVWPFLLTALVVLVWAMSGVLVWALADDPGKFGDMFGATNALFSGLAFAGVIYAILLQRRELKLQRDELELTRGELAGQRQQLQAQNETFQQQNFENTFFQLLRLHNDIVNTIDLRRDDGGVTAAGRDCFKVFYERLKKRWNKGVPEDAGRSEFERLNKTYLAFYGAVEAEIGHYFRSLYNIIKFIDNSTVSDKRIYTNLVRAQLSSYELALLFYNCLSEMGNEKFKPLVERYALLKMVPRHELLNPDAHVALYLPSAHNGHSTRSPSLSQSVPSSFTAQPAFLSFVDSSFRLSAALLR